MIYEFNKLLSNVSRVFSFESSQIPFQSEGVLSVGAHELEPF